ncbi:ras guanine nucleotide exchange factor domain-containing protein, partial [Phycomyces blakesleeanus]
YCRRRSKSFDDLLIKKNITHPDVITPPASPIIAFDSDITVSPKRRHSSCIESTTKECLRLATIYGWVTLHPGLGWVGVEEDDEEKKTVEYISITDTPPPLLPVENDPHVYDLLAQDNPSFIHYSNRNLTMMSSATVEKLVEKLTREMDSDFLMDFFLTYRQFVTPIKLCKLLILRFRWALMQDSDERQLVRIRTFVAIRHWLTHYWSHDFIPSRTLRFILCTFLSQLRTHPVIMQSPRDERIIKNLRNVLKRQRKLFDIENESGSLCLSMGSLVSDIRHSSQQWSDQSSRISVSLASFSYKPFVLRHRSEIVAQQFCIIEQQMLQNVTWDELAELRWRKRSRAMASNASNPSTDILEEPCVREGVDELIGFFNKICQWVASEIVRTRSIETRVQAIEKFIRIALKCYHQRNYSTLMQVLLGLQSPAVSRLEKTWQRVDHYELHIFGELKELAKPFRNWKNVRDCMTRATEDVAESSAVESILTQSETDPGHTLSGRGCIPFLGLYLSDLVFNSELPTYIEHTDNEESWKTSVEDAALNARLSTRLVNYNKFRITGKAYIYI